MLLSFCQWLIKREGDLPFESMAAITMFVDPAVWGAMVAEEHQSGVISTAMLAHNAEFRGISHPSGVHAKRSKVAS